MKILSVNAGSSSLKFQMYEMPEEKVLISGNFERIGINGSFYTIKINGEKIKKEVTLNNHEDAVKILTEELLAYKVVDSLDEIKGVGHRVVHGGALYNQSVVIDDQVLKDIEELSDLAPLHNPANALGIKAFKTIIPDAVSVAVFDTAFHQTMDEVSYLYPLPYEWYEKYGVRKYGFHGTSHKYLSERLASILGKRDIKVITCHLGNGASISAVQNGKCIDTSMGFTTHAGVMMGSRSGDIDVTLIDYVMRKTGKTIDEIIVDLNKHSGLLGVSGVSNDNRDINALVKEGNERCILTKKMYYKRIVEYIAKYYCLLNGVDAICFSGGIGENSAVDRAEIMKRLEVFGIKLDEESNNNTHGDETLISSVDSKIKCYVIPTDEEVMIARDTFRFIK